MNLLDYLRDLVDDSWIVDFEELEEILDFNSIAFELVHEENQSRFINYVISIKDEYFLIIENTFYDTPIEVKKVKPHIVTKTEYIEL